MSQALELECFRTNYTQLLFLKHDLKRREYLTCFNVVHVNLHFMYSLLFFLLKSETHQGLQGLEKHFQVFTLGFLAFLLHISTSLPSNIRPSTATGALGVPTEERWKTRVDNIRVKQFKLHVGQVEDYSLFNLPLVFLKQIATLKLRCVHPLP